MPVVLRQDHQVLDPLGYESFEDVLYYALRIVVVMLVTGTRSVPRVKAKASFLDGSN